MATLRAGHSEAEGVGLVRAVLDVFESPALLIHDAGAILAANAAWLGRFASPDSPSTLPSVSEWLAQLTDGDSLAAALGATGDATGLRTARVSHHCCKGITRYAVRVTSAQNGDGLSRTHSVVMFDAPPPSLNTSLERAQHQIHRLLVRQTVIEERERRRLGRALHDQVTQVLVEVRRQLASTRDDRGHHEPAKVIADVDRAIHLLQEITSNFSPPVLEDLGLLPAMRWLADHLQSTSGAAASCDDDGREPSLSIEVRTIVFRALRELAQNAVKHAPGARIRLRASVVNARCQFEVCDDGPGFVLGGDNAAPHQRPRSPGYGLLSIEQQVLAIGGTFEIRTAPGAGTRAIITLDTAGREELDLA